MQGIVILLLILAVVVLGPLLTIWSLNTLFPVLAIPFTFKTWFAALILAGLFKTTIKKSND